jgi:hypothetical protein
MKNEVLFDDIRRDLKRQDKRQTPHPIVPILLNLGLQRQTVTNYLVDKNACGRASGYNLMNGEIPKVPMLLEQQLLNILKLSIVQAIKISKNYKKMHTMKAIERLNNGIISAKHYLESLNEPMEIDFDGIGESMDLEGFEQSGWLSYIEHS